MSTNIQSFFFNLDVKLSEVRLQAQQQLERIFDVLNRELEKARETDLILDKKCAHRFNSFEYMVTSELGLSKIISDLLNPKASHGQGPLFLNILLNLIKETSKWTDLDTSKAKISKEKRIYPKDGSKSHRQVDITVEIPNDDGIFFLVIENKPYSGDQEGQIMEYLNYFEGKCSLLIYIPPNGMLPSEKSISREELTSLAGGCGINRFAIMPYYWNSGESIENSSDFDAVRVSPASSKAKTDQITEHRNQPAIKWEDFFVGCSLIDWLEACREECSVERLRWFFGDAIEFCHKQFGGLAMTSDSEARTIRKFLFSNPKNLETAGIIYKLFPEVKNTAIHSAASALRRNVEKELQSCQNLKFSATQVLPREIILLSIYKACWPKHEDVGNFTEGRISISLGLWRSSLEFYWGIYAQTPKEKGGGLSKHSINLHNEIIDRFRNTSINLPKSEGINGSWLCWNSVEEEYSDGWKVIIDLLRESECEKECGDTMDYFVTNIVRIVNEAIPIFNEINRQ